MSFLSTFQFAKLIVPYRAAANKTANISCFQQMTVLAGAEYAGHNGARRPRKWCSQTA